jgi:hypothetical protein
VAKRRLKPWKDLSPSYRKRLQAAGITGESRRRGIDLRVARGHTPRPRPGQAPADVIAARTPTPSEVSTRRLWRETLAPGWLPNRQRMGDATAAALSQLRNPRDWTHVQFTPAPPGQSWTMEVSYVSGYPQTIQLPPDAYMEVLDLIVLVRQLDGYVTDEGAWEKFVERGRDYDVAGTP